MLKVPCSPEIVLCASAANSGELGVAIQVKFDLTFTPPAAIVDLPCQLRTHIMAFAFNTLQQSIHLLISERVAASPLGMQASNIVGYLAHPLVDLVVQLHLVATEVLDS